MVITMKSEREKDCVQQHIRCCTFFILANQLLYKFVYTRHTFFVWQPHFFHHFFSAILESKCEHCRFCSVFLPFISSNTYCNFVFLLFSNDFNSLPVPVFYLWVPFFTIQTTNYRQISIGLDSHIQLHHNVVLLL